MNWHVCLIVRVNITFNNLLIPTNMGPAPKVHNGSGEHLRGELPSIVYTLVYTPLLWMWYHYPGRKCRGGPLKFHGIHL